MYPAQLSEHRYAKAELQDKYVYAPASQWLSSRRT